MDHEVGAVCGPIVGEAEPHPSRGGGGCADDMGHVLYSGRPGMAASILLDRGSMLLPAAQAIWRGQVRCPIVS